MSECDVLIVGAGPVGLTAANTLARHGVRIQLIERLAEPVCQSRAAAIQSRTLEVIERLGLAELFLQCGTPVHGVQVFDEKKKLIAEVLLDELDAPYPFMLGLGQTVTERILTQSLIEHGVMPRRNTELISFTQTESGITAQLKGPEGREETLQAQYLIGCDGGKSTVRHQLGLTLKGETLPSHWLTADCCIDWEFSRDKAVAFLVPGGFAFIMAIEENRWRVIAPLTSPLPENRQAQLEDVQAACDQLLPVKLHLHNPHWVTQFGLNTRLVTSFRQGRVFLCGDSAHIHSPVGGQGMNTGIQDAFNLGWKLAWKIQHQSGEKLLESYHEERHGNARRMLSGVGPSTKMVNLQSPLAASVRNAIAHFALQFDVVRSHMRRSVSEMDVNYRGSSLVGEWVHPVPPEIRQRDVAFTVLDGCADFSVGPHPGDRAPDIESLIPGNGEQKRLFELWSHSSAAQILIFLGDSLPERQKELLEFQKAALAGFSTNLEITLIQSGNGVSTEYWHDPEGLGHHRYGARHECLYFIRPDGYVAFRCQPVTWDPLMDFYKKLVS